MPYLSKQRRSNLLMRLDWPLIILYLLMVAGGWLAICGATYDFTPGHLLEMGGRPMQQLIWISLALVLGGVVLLIDEDLFESGAPYLYIGFILLLIVTAVVAPDIKGSRSWLVMGPIRVQPAEFAKLGTALMLAYWLNRPEFKLTTLRGYLEVFAIILLPMAIIILQSETGSALVFCAFFLALYREGLSGAFLLLASLAVTLFVVALMLADVSWGATDASRLLICSIISVATILYLSSIVRWKPRERRILWIVSVVYFVGMYVSLRWLPIDYSYVALALMSCIILFCFVRALLHYSRSYLLVGIASLGLLAFSLSVEYVYNDILAPHQQMRIAVSLGIEQDPRGAGYNVDQAKIAIGSGGLMGKGFLQGTQTKLKYVPEQDTDFIFCTIGEEQGFAGSVGLLLLFLTMILRIMWRAEQHPSTFGRVYGYCLACVFIFHLMVNVGMVLGLVPVIGIPLPFFSYGGSSLWGFSLMLALFLKIDASGKR